MNDEKELAREVRLILENLKEHSPQWVRILRKYIKLLKKAGK